MDEFETVVGLVSRYSPSGQEQDAVAWLVERMRSLGYDDAFMDPAGNAVGVMGRGPRQVVLLGHIDTVPGQIAAHVDDGVLYGRGSVDAKGPLACFVDAVARVGAMEGWQFIVIGAVEEERDSEGARFAAEQYQPNFAITGEPSQWDRITLGYKGSAGASITIRCEQAHTASGEQTAPEAAIDRWLKIKSYVDSFNADREKLFDQLLLTLRGMESASNDFEQWARLDVGVRLPLDVSPEVWYAKLRELAEGAIVESIGFPIPAWVCEKNTPLVRMFLSGIRSQGGEPRFIYKTGTADLNIVAPLWLCPALVYGPGNSALDHTPNEHLALKDFTKAVNVLCHALRGLTGGNLAGSV
ncbi:MAG TPA: [LysW]-lysine hydrolase [Anaerolineales bacterium]|nr:[LysW]-lysine hydrolase [Anaerolineales bacterium]